MALLEVLLIGHRQQRLGIGILGGLTPAVHLLGEQAPLTAVGRQFGAVQPGGLEEHSELVGRSPALGILLAGRHHLPLQASGLSPLLEGDHVNAQLLGDLVYDLLVRWSHPPADISLESLAVATHRSVPSSPPVAKVVGMKRRHLSWQSGLDAAKAGGADPDVLCGKVCIEIYHGLINSKSPKSVFSLGIFTPVSNES